MIFDRSFFIKMLLLVALIWVALTFVVESQGPNKANVNYGKGDPATALVLYDPDPFYNLDEQVCHAFAKGFASGDWSVEVATLSSIDEYSVPSYDLYAICANTYNFAPDLAILEFIRQREDLVDKPVVAITLGSGSTERAQIILENKLKDKGARVVFSEAFWLMRPNDESRMEASNVGIAVEQAQKLGVKTAQWFDQGYSFELVN